MPSKTAGIVAAEIIPLLLLVSVQTILLASACIVVVSTCYSASAHGAEFDLQPAITINEEYTDNLFLTTTDRKDDYITRVVPSIRWTYKAPLWDWDVAYAYDHRYYAKYRDDQDLYTLDLKNHTRILGDFLQLDIEDVHARKPLSVVRDWTQESYFLNQTDINTFTVNPYIRMRTSSNSRVTIGYWYRNIWHQDPTAIDTIDHRVYTTANYDLSANLTTNMDVRYTSTEAGNDRRRRMDLFGGFDYVYAMDSKSWFKIGNTWFAFGTADETSQVTWDAGIAQKSGKYSYSFAAKLTYLDDPFYIVRREDRYVATVNRDTERTSLGISAGRYEYRKSNSKHLENTRYELTGKISHASSQTSKIIYDLSIGRIEDNVLDQYTAIYRGGVRFEYMPSATLRIALQYRYANAYSPDVYTANYDSNRVMVEINKSF
jgi:hypothetical protein